MEFQYERSDRRIVSPDAEIFVEVIYGWGKLTQYILHIGTKRIGFRTMTEFGDTHDYEIGAIGCEITAVRGSRHRLLGSYHFESKQEIDATAPLIVEAVRCYARAQAFPKGAAVRLSPWLEYALNKGLLLSKRGPRGKQPERPIYALTDFPHAFLGKNVGKLIRGAMLLEQVGYGSDSNLHGLLTGSGLVDQLARKGEFEAATRDWVKVVTLAQGLSAPDRSRSIISRAIGQVLGTQPESLRKGAAFGPLIRAMALEIGGAVYWPVFLSTACGGGSKFLRDELWGKALGELLIERLSKEASALSERPRLEFDDLRAPVRNYSQKRANGSAGWKLIDDDTGEHFLSVLPCVDETTAVNAYRSGRHTATLTLDQLMRTKSLALIGRDQRQLVVSWDTNSQLPIAQSSST